MPGTAEGKTGKCPNCSHVVVFTHIDPPPPSETAPPPEEPLAENGISETVDEVTANSLPDDLARQTLLRLIQDYGIEVAEDPRRCEGLLRDLCAACRREIHVLMAAVNERVIHELREADSELPVAVTIGRLVKRLVDNRGITEDAALWAVESWALAFGLITPDELTPASVLADKVPDGSPGPSTDSAHRTENDNQTHDEVLAKRRGDGLSAKAWRLLRSLSSIVDIDDRLESAEEALAAFTQAIEILADDTTLQQGLDETLGQVATVSARSGNQALRKRNFSLAMSLFKRVLEIDPGNAEAESRVKSIRRNREELITKARTALGDGQYKSSERVLCQLLELFPGDVELKSLLSDSQTALEKKDHFIQHQLPELETQKKLFELIEIIQGMHDKGLHIPELKAYQKSLQDRVDSVVPILQRAEESLAGGHFSQAEREANTILAQVADHEGALQIKHQVKEYLAATHNAGDAIRKAHGQALWFEARQLHLLHPNSGQNTGEWQQILADIESGTVRSLNYWRTLTMVFLGFAFWILAGKFALVFSGGITDTLLQQDPSSAFGNSITETVAGRSAHLFLALVSLPFLAATIAGRGAMRSLGFLFAIVIGHALFAIGLVSLRKEPIPPDTIMFALIYGVAAGAFLAGIFKRILQDFESTGPFAAMGIGLLVATLFPLVQKLPARFSPDVLSSKILLAIVLCSMLQLLGLVRRWKSFSFVPIAVFIAYGLDLGSSESWDPYLPWLNGLLIAGSVVLMTTATSNFKEITSVLVIAPVTTLLFILAPEIETLPPVKILLGVWLAVWGSLVIIQKDDIEPNRSFLHFLRLWKSRQAVVTRASAPEE